MLFHAKDHASDIVADIELNRRKGWQRICLFALYFQPRALDILQWSQVLQDALKATERSRKAYFGLYPFKWQSDWLRSFDALRGNGRLFVAPILQTLILNRAPQETIDWADKVASWDFRWIIPCHFDSPIQAEPQQFRQAFSFLSKQSTVNGGLLSSSSYPLPEEDFKVLREIDAGLNKFGIVPAAKEKV